MEEMKINRIGMRVLSVLILLLSSSAFAVDLSCSIKTSCGVGETDVLHMSDEEDGHAELPAYSNFTYRVCCSDLDAETTINNAGGTAFLRLSDGSNAHVEKVTYSNFSYDAYISSDNSAYYMSCGYGTNSCAGYDTCLGSISEDSNAHIGNCSAFSTTVCCSLVPAGYTEVPACGRINSSGRYILSANLTGAPISTVGVLDFTNACLYVDEVNNVVIDCNGYNITNNGTGSAGGIVIDKGVNVTVENCPGISNYQTGVHIYDGTYAGGRILRNITSFNNTDYGFGTYRAAANVTGCVAYDNVDGFYRFDQYSVFTDNEAYNNSQHGFYFQWTNYINFTNNTAHHNNQRGIYHSGNNDGWFNFVNNTAYSNGHNGFDITGNIWNNLTNNTAYDNGQRGFFGGGNYLRFIGNNATNNSYDGYYSSYYQHSYFEDNIAIGNGWGGVTAGSGFVMGNLGSNNTIVNLTSCYNYEEGIDIASPNNTFINSTFCYNGRRNNEPGILFNRQDGQFFNNTEVYGNHGEGIFVDRTEGVVFHNTHVYNNSPDFLTSGISSAEFRLYNFTVDNPLGNYVNYTTMNVSDFVESTYRITWKTNVTPPTNYILFKGMVVEVIESSGGGTTIDSINWTWKDSEVTGYYDESKFGLWEYYSNVSGSGWNLVNGTPDTDTNLISQVNLSVDYGSTKYFAILQSNVTNNPPIVENITLNSTYGTNYTTENLTVYWDSYDPNGDPVKNITNWYLNGTSITVLNMPFEATGGNESTWTKDYSNNSNHGTVNSATWNSTGGYDGWGAYEFTGTEYISVADAPFDFINGSNEFSVEAWIYPEATSGYRMIVAKHAPTADGWWFGLASGKLELGSQGGGYATSTNDIILNEWQHVVATYNGTRAKVYHNGTLWATASTALSSTVNDLNLDIGRQNGAAYFDGRIDQVKLYNRILTPEQVQLLYQNRTDMIHSNEISVGDIWQACITPNDGYEDGSGLCSNTLTVLEEVVSYDITECQEISASGGYTLTADLSGNLSNGACILVTTDNVTVDCAGHSISDDAEAYGIWIDSANNVSLLNCVVSNFSNGIYLYNATNCSITNVNSTDSEEHNYFIDESSDVKLTSSNAHRGRRGGAHIVRSASVHIDPSYFCDSPYGILVNDSNHTLIDDSIACRNTQIGIYVLDSHNTTIEDSRTYDNALDLRVENNRGTAVDFTATRLTFDGPAGDWTDYTTMDITDSVAASTRYDLNWTSLPAALPPNWTAFHNKYVDITNGTGSVSIDTVVWRWTESESAGFNESELDIWEYSTGGWNIIASAFNAVANTLTVSNLVPSSDYGPLYNGTPLVSVDLYGANVSNVTDYRWEGESAGNWSVEGGNISDADISSQSLTDRWAAYFGNVSGSLMLTDNPASNYVYQWAWDAGDGGAICLSTNNSLTGFPAMGAAGSDIDSAWSFDSTSIDSGTNTFAQNNCTMEIGSANISNSSYVDNGQTGGFLTCALKQSATTPTKPEMLFCTRIIQNGLTYNSTYADFEVMVPTAYGPTATETYYFYLNLG